MRRTYKAKLRISRYGLLVWLLGSAVGLGVVTAHAQPFGVGLFNANVPFGGQTSLTIATSGNVSLTLSPTGPTVTGTSTVTVTSSDVVGYNLYIRALTSTDLANGAATIPASSNGSPAALSVNTWGYNTDNSTNYVGLTTSDTLLKSATGPFTSGDATPVYYGVKVDYTTKPGAYSDTVIYTAVPQTT